MNKNRYSHPGFTLAEVVITLIIIGIVAAMTIPIVISNSTKEQSIAGVKKAYNTLKAVQKSAMQTQGDIASWRITGDNENDFKTFFKEHFKILKDCGNSSGCFANTVYYLPGDVATEATRGYKFISLDGMLWSYDAQTRTMFVDVNGLKKPNKVGVDIFVFELNNADRGEQAALGFVPVGNGWTGDELTKSCEACGYACTAKVLSEGAMNYRPIGASTNQALCRSSSDPEQESEENIFP